MNFYSIGPVEKATQADFLKLCCNLHPKVYYNILNSFLKVALVFSVYSV